MGLPSLELEVGLPELLLEGPGLVVEGPGPGLVVEGSEGVGSGAAAAAATAGSSSTNMGGMPASTMSVSMSRYSSCRSIESGLSGTTSAPIKSGKELLSARGKKNKHKA